MEELHASGEADSLSFGASSGESGASGPSAAFSAPMMVHLAELRRRILWILLTFGISTAFAYLFSENIYGILVRPLANAMGEEGGTSRLIYTGLTEAFVTYIRLAVFAGMLVTAPVALMHLWMFIAPGLYGREKRVVLPFLVATPLLFMVGGAFVYFLLMPMAWPFFLSFQTSAEQTALPVQLEARVGEYLDLVMTLIFAFGLCFQLPVLLCLLARVGFLKAETLASKRRYAIVLIFLVAAFLTPPDVFSQILLAVPLCGLYEISILLVRRMERSS